MAIERALIELASDSDMVIREMRLDLLNEEIAREATAIRRQLDRRCRNRLSSIAGLIPGLAKTVSAVGAQN